MHLRRDGTQTIAATRIQKISHCLALAVIFGTGIFFLGPTSASAQVTISGNVYSDAGVTGLAASRNIRAAVGTSTIGIFNASSTAGTGAYTITIPAGHGISTGTPITVFIDGATEKGAVVTKAQSASTTDSITGLHIYQNRVISRHEAVFGTSTAMGDFTFYGNREDADVQFSVATTTNELAIFAGNELFVWASTTLALGGSLSVQGNAGANTIDGSINLADLAVFVPGGNTTLAGSFRASSSAIYTPSRFFLIFNATTTGKVINTTLTTLGNIRFAGVGGAWSFTQSNATTSEFTVVSGTVTAPSGTLVVNGVLQNFGSFLNNSGAITIAGPFSTTTNDIARYAVGRDSSGNNASTSAIAINNIAVSGSYLYAVKGGSAIACSQAVGFGAGCELQVFDISSSTNPIYVAGRDSSGSSASTSAVAINSLAISGNFLFTVNAGSATTCSQAVGFAAGCELQVWDISTPTNPVFMAARDSSGSTASTSAIAITNVTTSGSYLYVSKGASSIACSQAVGFGAGCEVMVFDISSSTVPTYVAGRDVRGDATGAGNIQANNVAVVNNTLYVVKAGDATGCLQTTGTGAGGCELMAFDITTPTNPVYVAGRDVSGSTGGTGNLSITNLTVVDRALYVTKAGNATACSSVAGSAIGCEIMAFDISSTTVPTFVAGRDVSGSSNGVQSVQVNNLKERNGYLYVGKASNAVPCSSVVGLGTGCEMMVFDVASSSGFTYILGRDSAGSDSGVDVINVTDFTFSSTSVFVSKAGSATACTQVAGTATGCELMVFDTMQRAAGLVAGAFTNTNAFNTVAASGTVRFIDTASTSHFTVGATATVTAPSLLSLSGDYTNDGIFLHTEGTMVFASTAAQTLGGLMTGTSSLSKLIFQGSGSKTFLNNASTTEVTIEAGSTLVAPDQLSFSDTFTNNGTFTAGTGTLSAVGYLGEFLGGSSAGGATSTDLQSLTYNAMAVVGTTLYVAKANSNTACSQTAGSAVGCELMVYNIASTAYPIYAAGRDSSGNNASTSNIAYTNVLANGNYLYTSTAGSNIACSQAAGFAAGCELQVWDISAPTNPVFRAGRDSSGNAASTSAVGITAMAISGNFLFITKTGSAATCTQIAAFATGCELMVWDISSSTDPIFRTGLDSSGSTASTSAISMTNLAISGNYLYVSKTASNIVCSQAVGFAAGCEIMVIDISSSTVPTYVVGRDINGDSTGTGNLAVNNLVIASSTLYVVKGGGGTGCLQTTGTGAGGCELMVFNITTPTNPVYVAGRDVSGNATGTGNANINTLKIVGGLLYTGKVGDATVCTERPGLALGCELQVWDIASSTNPVYVLGSDTGGLRNGREATAIQSVFATGTSFYIGKAASAIPCQPALGLAVGCELMGYQLPALLSGGLSGNNALNSLTVYGDTEITSTNASTTNLTITSGGTFTAPTGDLSLAGNFNNSGTLAPNGGEVILTGTNQQVSGVGTTTFFDFTQRTAGAATTTFSAGATYQILGTLILQGSTTGALKLRGTSGVTQWRIDPWATTSVSYLDVRSSQNIGATNTLIVCSLGCLDSGNNTNWAIGIQQLLSGILYADEGQNPLTGGFVIKLAIDGEVVTTMSTSSHTGTGAYSFLVSESLLATGTPLLVFIDATTTKAATLTKASTTKALPNLHVYKDRLIVRHEGTSSTSTTNTDFGFYTSSDDSDVPYAVTNGGLTVASGIELYVWTGDTFAPGGAVMVQGNASTSLRDGSMRLTANSSYIAGGNTTLAGSFSASSSASYTPATTSALVFNATSTGKVINTTLLTLGNVSFTGAGGAWSFMQANATTSDFKTAAGTVTAPSSNLSVTGVFSNYGTFVNNNSLLKALGSTTDLSSLSLEYVAGRDESGSAGGSGNSTFVTSMVTSGNYQFVSKYRDATPCSQVAGSASGCELMVFDISSTTNPIYVAGRDVSGDTGGSISKNIEDITINGNTLYAVTEADATPCSQVSGSAEGCELIVFDISSSTNPVYVAGRDGAGLAAGTSTSYFSSVAFSGNTLALGRNQSAFGACFQVSGSTTACELVFFDISSSTNPVFTAGRDTSGSAGGSAFSSRVTSFEVKDNILYVSKDGDGTVCSQVAGSATGCEFMVFDIASSTNPVYVAGRDGSGSATTTFTNTINTLLVQDQFLYMGKYRDAGTCSNIAGSAVGCELVVWDISSTTNPVFVAGRDASGATVGSSDLDSIYGLSAVGNYLATGKEGNATPCSQVAGSAIGCELMVWDISSSTNPTYLVGRDRSGNATGTAGLYQLGPIAPVNNSFYVASGQDTGSCSQTAGLAGGCDIMVFTVGSQPRGILQGNLTGASLLNNIQTSGRVTFRDNSSTADFTIASGTTTAPSALTISGDYSNSGVFTNNSGIVFASSSSAQNLSGTMTGASTFGDIIFGGSGTKTFSNNASATSIRIDAAAQVTAPASLSINGSLLNNGVFSANNGTITITQQIKEFLAGRDSSGNSASTSAVGISRFVSSGNYLYAAKNGSSITCSQAIGFAAGCELLVFDISSSTNPVFVAGRDSSGSTASTSAISMTSLSISGNYLYAVKAGSATTCSQAVGFAAGCELMVFDISSSTNPVYVAGRDSSGSTASTSAVGVGTVMVIGSSVYVAKAGNSTACSQAVGFAAGCELMVFNIASATNPIYVAGRDSSGDAAGTGSVFVTAFTSLGNILYAGKDGDATACSQTAGSAAGCELMVFDISSSTNPIYVAGRDISGNTGGTGLVGVYSFATMGATLYVGKQGDATACSQTAGSAIGCELMVFDVSSTTNPIYFGGRDASGDATGTDLVNIFSISVTGTTLYAGKEGDATACSQTAGSAIGCELMVFDISASNSPVYVAGRDGSGSVSGTSTEYVNDVTFTGGALFVGKNSNATACSQVAGSAAGCELVVFDLDADLSGNLVGVNSFNNLIINGPARFNNAASTTNLTITSNNYLTAPATDLSISGNFTNNGTFAHNNGEVTLTGTNQTLTSGATTTFYDFTQVAGGAATTTFSTSSPWVIERNLTLSGTTSAPLKLRSTATGQQWRIDPQSSTTVSVAYLDLRDSNNISTATTSIACVLGCVNSGNNTNWNFASSGTSTPVWNATDWTLYDTITIQQENIDSDLTDFPVYVNLDDLSSTFWSTTPTGSSTVGTDIRVTTASNVEVPRELVTASSTLQTGELHFKAPTISSTTDTVFKIWYNGTTTGDYADSATYGAENVWTNDYVAVWHLQEDPSVAGASGILDATGNGNNGTDNGSMDATDAVSGKLGGRSLDFDGVDDFIQVTGLLGSQSEITISSWADLDAYDTSGNSQLFSIGDYVGFVANTANARGFFYTGSAWPEFARGGDIAAASWTHLTFTQSNSGNQQRMYVNNTKTTGSNVSDTSYSTLGTDTFIGKHANGSAIYDTDGRMDELRVASTTRTDAWIRAEYTNQSTSTDFYSVNLAGAVGSSTIANHTSGQVNNTFTGGPKTNESLFAFRLTPNSGNATVTDAVITLTGVQGFNPVTGLTNLRLFRDIDNDALYDVTDVAVGGAGAIVGANQNGTLTFTTDFLSTTSQNYLVVGDWSAPADGTFITFNLFPSGLTIIDATSSQSVFGSVSSAQHYRNNRGGGGQSASIGGGAPAGNGTTTGGGTTGGQLIGDDPDFFWPSANSGSWNSGANAYDRQDGTYATTSAAVTHTYTNPGFAIPTNNTIGGIEVKLELGGTTGAGTVNVELSWNNGANWTSAKTTPTLTTTDTVRVLGAPADLWGRSWTASEFTNANFALRLTGAPSANTIRVDAIQIKVYHAAGGGSQGGGGGGGI